MRISHLVAVCAGVVTVAHSKKAGSNLFPKRTAQILGGNLGSSLGNGAGAALAQSLTGGDPNFASMISGAQDGVKIGQELQQCYNSVKDNPNAVNDAYSGIASDLKSSGTQSAMAGFGLSMVKAFMSSSSDQDLMMKLYKIYLDKEANGGGGTLSDAQNAAYASLTQECTTAFDDMTEAYKKYKNDAENALEGNRNTTCSTYENKDSSASMALCVFPPYVYNVAGDMYANISATFTNYGVMVCNVTFFVMGIEGATKKSPSWLPASSVAYPNGIPQYTDLKLSAVIPYQTDIADSSQPLYNVFTGWYACPNGKNTPAPAPRTPAPTQPPLSNSMVNNLPSCFRTNQCLASLTPDAADCAQYKTLLSSGCSSCSAAVLEQTRQSCLQGCATGYCATTSPDANKQAGNVKSTSPAAHAATFSAILVGGAALLTIMALQL